MKFPNSYLEQYTKKPWKSDTNLNIVIPDGYKENLSHVVLKDNDGNLSVYTKFSSEFEVPLHNRNSEYTIYLLFGGRQVYHKTIKIEGKGTYYLNVDTSKISEQYSDAFPQMLDNITKGKILVEVNILDDNNQRIPCATIKTDDFSDTYIDDFQNKNYYLWFDSNFRGRIEISSLGYRSEIIHYKKGQNSITVRLYEDRLSTAW